MDFVEINKIMVGSPVVGVSMINYTPYNPSNISFEVSEIHAHVLYTGLECDVKYGHIDGKYRITSIEKDNRVYLELIK